MAIRKSETTERGVKVYKRELDGVYDVSDIALERIHEGKDSLGNASLDSSKEFCGTSSLEEAWELCTYGWPEGANKVSEVVDAIHIDHELLQKAQSFEIMRDVAGDEPDVDRYLQGDPNNMVTYIPNIQTHGRMLDIVVNIGQHARVDKSQIINRGVSILAAVEALRAHSYAIGIVAVERCKSSYYGGSDVIQHVVPILEHGQAVNVDTLAFTTMHPSFLRRLMFAVDESESHNIREKFGYMAHGGYGTPLSLEHYKHDTLAFVIDKDDGLTSNTEAAAKFAQKIAEKCLNTLKVGGEDFE